LPSLIWLHDHALGITRLNVYMGLAAGYVITDAYEQSLNLPAGEFDVPLVIQDRSFYPDGSLKYPAVHQEHFFGDIMMVNGKIWPYLNVKQGKYRLRTLNGCNSRTLRLSFSNGQSFHQIGTDGGLLETPVPLSEVLIGPGERAELVFDFAASVPGTEILLLNTAPAPYPNGDPMHELPNVMKFVVTAEAGDADPLPATLRPLEVLNPNDAMMTRDFVLRKMPDACTGSMWMINDLPYDTITEYPLLGATEIWNYINRSGVSHPMHMHLVMFQVLNRQDFEVVDEQIVPIGNPIPPEPNEVGWKDTVMVHPSQMTRVIAKFENYTGKYSYHCHILEHEEHEMMRQFESRCVKGDTTQDLKVDGKDIQLFVDTLVGGGELGTAAYCATDMDDNGTLDSGIDIPLFVDCLLQEVCP
jgi:spore coat protein A